MATNNFLEDLVFKTVIDFDFFPETKTYKIIVALSGGPDSMYLLYVLSNLRRSFDIKLIPVHINHLLRDSSTEESKELREYVLKQFKLETLIFSSDVKRLASKWKRGVEETGRIVRRQILNYVFDKYEADYIALGHNLDDQVETVLFRMFRGTGLNGMLGMKPKDNNIIRPLFFIEKSSILKELNEKKLFYIYDYSNYELKYSRNLIRHKIIPLAEIINCNAKKHIFEVSMDISQAYEYINLKWKELLKRNLLLENEEFLVFKAELLKGEKYIVSEAIKGIFEKFSGSVYGLARKHINCFIVNASKKGSYSCFLPKKIYVSKSCEIISFWKKKDFFNGFNFILKKNGTLKLPNNLGKINVNIEGALESKVYLRSFTEGDRYKNKKLKEVFLEKRVPKDFRKAIPLVAIENEVLHIFVFDGEKTVIELDNAKIQLSFQPSELYCKIKNFLV
jgi:tRNA(Ile)-lysidine synthase